MKTQILLQILATFFIGIQITNAQTNPESVSNNDIVLVKTVSVESDVEPYTLSVDPILPTKFVITRLKQDAEHAGINLFPNPVKDVLHLNFQRVEDLDIDKMSYALVNESGEELMRQEVTELIENIDMSNFESSKFKVRVYAEDEVIKSYQVSIR